MDMFITSGPDFPPNYDAMDLTLTPWGNLQIDFSSETQAVANWTTSQAGFSGGSMDIWQIVALSSGADSCISGSYGSADEDGHGISAEVVTVSGVEMLVVFWYVYLDGQQVWLSGLGPITDGVATVALERFSGVDFPPVFVTDEVLSQHWGTITLQFTEVDVNVSWDSDDPDFSDGAMVMDRITTLAGHVCQ